MVLELWDCVRPVFSCFQFNYSQPTIVCKEMQNHAGGGRTSSTGSPAPRQMVGLDISKIWGGSSRALVVVFIVLIIVNAPFVRHLMVSVDDANRFLLITERGTHYSFSVVVHSSRNGGGGGRRAHFPVQMCWISLHINSIHFRAIFITKQHSHTHFPTNSTK